MTVSNDEKQGTLGGTTEKVRKPNETSSPKSEAKKEGTRVSTLVDVRGSGNKKGKDQAGSRDRLRDGS